MPSRTLPNLGLKGFYDVGENGWGAEMSASLLKLSVLVQGGLKSRVAAVPGAPAEGDVHVLTAAPHAQNVAVYDDGAWVYYVPNEGWLLYDRGADVYVTFDGAAWAELATGTGDGGGGGGGGGTGDPVGYRVGGFFTSAPAGGEVLLMHAATDPFTIAADLVGSEIRVGTNPSADTVLTLAKNGVSIGTMTISAAGAVAFDGAGGAVVAGDLLTITGPADANGLANVAFTIYGEQAGAVGGGGGGGGGGASGGYSEIQFAIDTRPEAAAAFDDEFDGNALDGAWLWTNKASGGVTADATVKNSQLRIVTDLPQGGQQNRMLGKAVPAGDFDIIAKVRIDGVNVDYHGIGLCAFNTANGRFLTNKLHFRSAGQPYIGWSRWNSITSSGAEGNIQVAVGLGYLRLKRVGTTLICFYSQYGNQFSEIHREDMADWVGAFDQLAFCYDIENAGYIPHMAVIDWIRDYQGVAEADIEPSL